MNERRLRDGVSDERRLRDAMGAFATGVAVAATIAADGSPVGVTINSFASVSLDPPLVSFCLAHTAGVCQIFAQAPHFAITVLAEHQAMLSLHFSRRGETNRFAEIPYSAGATGSPILTGGLSYFECERFQTIAAGDHDILLGRVVALGVQDSGRPLLYFRGCYATLGMVAGG